MASHPRDYLPLTPIALEILVALGDGERHGYDIMLAIEQRTAGGLSPNPGTLYRAIDRLAREGLLASSNRASSSRPAGADPRRRFFELTELGRQVAAAEVERLADQVKAARGTRLLKKVTGG